MDGFTVLLNPVAGGGRALAAWDPVARRMADAGASVAVVTTRSREHAVELASKASARGDVVVAVGGDGLVRDAASGVVPEAGRLAIVPAGRGNDLARVLGVVDDPDALARTLLTGRTRVIDVLRVGDTYVPGNVYAGIDALATRVINANRWLPAALLYRIAPLRAILGWHPPTYEVGLDGTSSTVRAHTVVAANSGAYGHGLSIVPSARLEDGRMHVLVIGEVPRRQVARFMREAKSGAHVRRPEVSVAAGRVLSLAADRPIPLCADGDEVATLPARVELVPAALPVLVAASVRASTP